MYPSKLGATNLKLVRGIEELVAYGSLVSLSLYRVKYDPDSRCQNLIVKHVPMSTELENELVRGQSGSTHLVSEVSWVKTIQRQNLIYLIIFSQHMLRDCRFQSSTGFSAVNESKSRSGL